MAQVDHQNIVESLFSVLGQVLASHLTPGMHHPGDNRARSSLSLGSSTAISRVVTTFAQARYSPFSLFPPLRHMFLRDIQRLLQCLQCEVSRAECFCHVTELHQAVPHVHVVGRMGCLRNPKGTLKILARLLRILSYQIGSGQMQATPEQWAFATFLFDGGDQSSQSRIGFAGQAKLAFCLLLLVEQLRTT